MRVVVLNPNTKHAQVVILDARGRCVAKSEPWRRPLADFIEGVAASAIGITIAVVLFAWWTS